MRFRTSIVETIRRTEDVQSIRFQKPVEFSYTPGQFMFLVINSDGEKLEKHFTLSSSPSEDYLEITKKLTGHPFSNALLDLVKGDLVSLEGPHGDFSYMGKPEKVLFLTGGIGITPIRSIIRYCEDMNIKADMVLLYSCKDENNILFKDELDVITGKNNNLKISYSITRPKNDWTGIKGRINEDMIKLLVPDYASRDIYISGPLEMVESLNEVLKTKLNVPSNQIHIEKFLGL